MRTCSKLGFTIVEVIVGSIFLTGLFLIFYFLFSLSSALPIVISQINKESKLYLPPDTRLVEATAKDYQLVVKLRKKSSLDTPPKTLVLNKFGMTCLFPSNITLIESDL